MHRGLYLVAGSTVTNPDHTVARRLSGVENSDHITRAEFGVESYQQRPTEADVTGAGFLQEAVAPRVYAPDGESEVDIGARFAPAVFAWAVNAAEISHDLNVALERKPVNARWAARGTKVVGEVLFREVF